MLHRLPSRARFRFNLFTCRALLAAATLLCALPAVAQSSTSTLDALRAACSDDAARLCSGVQTGGGRIISCLKQHKDELSNGCRQAAGLPPRPVAAPDPRLQPSASIQPGPTWTTGTAGSPAPSPDTLDPNAPTSTPSSPASAPSASTQSAPVGKPTSVAGETFVRRVIADQTHDNVPAATLHLPEKWTLDSKVEWHYDQPENPVVVTAHAANPANAEALFIYPVLRMQWIEVAPQYRQYLRGQQSQAGTRGANGMMNMAPLPPMQALVTFIKQTRPDAKNLKFVGQQDLPTLAKTLKLSPWPNDHGVAVKISYDLNGQPVEEAFFGVFYSSQGGNEAKTVGQLHMAANAIKQTNWGFRDLQSFRAPAGTLDKRMAVFCLISKSLVYSPPWLKLAGQIHDQMTAAINQKIQQGYDQIRAGQAAMQQMQANEASLNAAVAKEDATLRSPGFDDSWLRTSGGGGSSSGGSLSSTDKFSNNLRNQETATDPTTGENTQVSNAGSYHFTDGFGNYRTSDDPNYTPEKAGESGSWTQMTVVQ
jgi:hypothetical protein